jgi:hypothetical protein
VGLQESKITKNIAKEAKLWRYMTLDKLINILSTQQLYFTPLQSYEKTDPFEGILPKVGLDAMKDLYSASRDRYLIPAIELRDILLEKVQVSQKK